MKNLKILLTGASQGIGAAIARRLHKSGHSLALVARSEDKLHSLNQELGGGHSVVRADLTELSSLPALVDSVAEQLGGIDALINNAGMGTHEPVGDGDPEKWHKLFHLNVLAVMELTREVVPYLKQSSNGALVTLSSISGQKAMKGLSAYCASKHAVRGFTLSCFEDLREDGIKVSTICPGMVNTGLPPDEGTDRSLMIQPEDIAHTVDFVLNFPSTACPTEITIRPQRSPTREG